MDVLFFYLYFKYCVNFCTAKDIVFLLRTAQPIFLTAGTSNSLKTSLYGILFKISSGKILIPNPLSTIDIIA